MGHAAEALLKHNKLFILFFLPKKSLDVKEYHKAASMPGKKGKSEFVSPWRGMQAELGCSTPCLAEASWLGCRVCSSGLATARVSLSQGRHQRGLGRQEAFQGLLK